MKKILIHAELHGPYMHLGTYAIVIPGVAVHMVTKDTIDAVTYKEPTPPTPPTVEDWMEANDVAPYRANAESWYWDGPDSYAVLGKEKLPADVWALVGGGLDDTETRDFPSRDDAVCALEVALRKLGKISE